jgi:hypothetical protein
VRAPAAGVARLSEVALPDPIEPAVDVLELLRKERQGER